MDPKVRLDLQVLRVLLFKETLAQLDTLDHPDLLVSLASRVVLGHWVQLALQDHLVFQDLWDPLELLDPRVALVLRDHWVHWDRPDKLDLLEIKVIPVRQDLLAHWVGQGRLDLLVHLEVRVFRVPQDL